MRRSNIILCLLMAVIFCVFAQACFDKPVPDEREQIRIIGYIKCIDEKMSTDLAEHDLLRYIYEYELRYFYAETSDKEQALKSLRIYKTRLIQSIEAGIMLSQQECKSSDDMTEQYIQMVYTTMGTMCDSAEKAVEQLKGVTGDELKVINRVRSLIKKYALTLYEEEPDSGEIAEYYESRRDEYDEISLRVIMLSLTEGAVNEGDVMERAENIRKRAKNGEDIIELTQSESEDPALPENGGLVSVKKDQQSGIFSEFISKADLAVGDMEILKDSSWIYVIICEKIFTLQNSEAIESKVKEDMMLSGSLKVYESDIIECELLPDWDITLKI